MDHAETVNRHADAIVREAIASGQLSWQGAVGGEEVVAQLRQVASERGYRVAATDNGIRLIDRSRLTIGDGVRAGFGFLVVNTLIAAGFWIGYIFYLANFARQLA